ncbi:hypothetical protein BKA65DRAFT_423016, partial [Rhexocercosporidium sp. MPI-PUGE-AT-0058]
MDEFTLVLLCLVIDTRLFYSTFTFSTQKTKHTFICLLGWEHKTSSRAVEPKVPVQVLSRPRYSKMKRERERDRERERERERE